MGICWSVETETVSQLLTLILIWYPLAERDPVSCEVNLCLVRDASFQTSSRSPAAVTSAGHSAPKGYSWAPLEHLCFLLKSVNFNRGKKIRLQLKFQQRG